MKEAGTHDRFDTTMRWIGDLDHPFYADERQRFVWYEASAIGFQLFVLLQLLMIGGALVVAGRAALPYVMFAFPAFVIGTLAAEFYAKKHHASHLIRWSDLRRGRSLLILGIAGLYVAGAARIALQPDAAGNYDPGLLVATVAAFGGLALGTWWRRRRQMRESSEDTS